MNYFELFELPVAPVINKGGLAKKYFELQKKYHPDFYTDATESEKEEVMKMSSEINKAFRIFQNEDDTLEYFLEVKGVFVKDEKYKLPDSFLFEVMELNEEFNGNPEEVELFKQAIYEPVKDLLKNFEGVAADAAALEKIKEYYYKKKYLQRILDRMEG